MKAIILARVSTEEQKEAGNSLPAQQARLISYVKRNPDLELIKEFIFDESAYKEHRKEFNKVLEFIKKQKETIALCCDKVDRLSRDFLVGLPALEKLRREGKIVLHFPSDNLILHKDSPATDLFHFNIAVSLAQYYSNSISDNVKRSFEYKIKHGEWIGKAPIGYKYVKDSDGNKTIIPAPETSLFIRKIFEMYSTGNYSLAQIAEKMEKIGLRNRNSKPLCKSEIYQILTNPFYCGFMRVKGRLYPHKYKPLISKFLFDKCQKVMEGYHKKPFKFISKPFIFRGLIKCKECGCTITPEIHKGYIYYSCTNYKKIHPFRIYVREEKLLNPIYEILRKIKLPEKILEEITEELRRIHQTENEFYQKELLKLKKEYKQIEDRINKTFDLLVDGMITKDVYDKKFKEYKEKQAEIEEKMKIYSNQDEFYLTTEMVLNLCNRAYEIFKNSEITEKRQILSFLFQNLQLSCEKLEYSLKEPFNSIIKHKNCSRGLGE